jgi:hypothetical protein
LLFGGLSGTFVLILGKANGSTGGRSSIVPGERSIATKRSQRTRLRDASGACIAFAKPLRRSKAPERFGGGAQGDATDNEQRTTKTGYFRTIPTTR